MQSHVPPRVTALIPAHNEVGALRALSGSYEHPDRLTVTSYVVNGFLGVKPFWLLIGAVFALERVITVWDQPWTRRLFAALVIPELIYALILQSAYLGAVWQKLNSSTHEWAHLGTITSVLVYRIRRCSAVAHAPRRDTYG